MNEIENTSKRLLDLQKLLYNFSQIKRMIYFPESVGKGRKETDTEHSFHLAILAWYASTHVPGLDTNKIVKYSLIHDLVEIYAGDVMAIGRTKEEQIQKSLKEKLALEKFGKQWKDFPELISSMEAYENQIDEESKFVKALDKLTPMLHNILGEGNSWKRLDLERSTILSNKDKSTKISKDVAKLWAEYKKLISNHPDWFNKGKA